VKEQETELTESEPHPPATQATRKSVDDVVQNGSEPDAPDSPMEVATYELARDELASVVGRLELGGLSLDESLTLWERGEYLAAVCSRFLEGARERVDAALAKVDRPAGSS
jgi:exodeoxyribonuclease VII small subunit